MWQAERVHPTVGRRLAKLSSPQGPVRDHQQSSLINSASAQVTQPIARGSAYLAVVLGEGSEGH